MRTQHLFLLTVLALTLSASAFAGGALYVGQGGTIDGDGATQITKRDEFIYQEMMSHVPLFAHGNARDVLIVGGGDCGIAEEVLKHKSVRQPYPGGDRSGCRRFRQTTLFGIHQAGFADKRFENVIGDGMKYVATTGQRFDVIIVNSTDPQGPGKILFGRKFYTACKRCMNKGGLLVTQNGVPISNPASLSPVSASLGDYSRTAPATSPRSQPISGAIWPWAGRPMTRGCARFRSELSRSAPSQGRQLFDQILDAGSPRSRIRPAPFYCRYGRKSEASIIAASRDRPSPGVAAR